MISTTIEQSKHLLELGLDPKTADMLYYPTAINEMGKTMFTLDVKGEYIYQEHEDECIPAWSLSTLLEVMPDDIKVDGEQYYHHLEKKNGFYILSYYFDDVDELYTLNTTKVCDTPIDAAYEMVCWLLENNLIKKGGEE